MLILKKSLFNFKITHSEPFVETDALCKRVNVKDTLSCTKECSVNKHNDNKDIFNNDILEDHNNELGPGEHYSIV